MENKNAAGKKNKDFAAYPVRRLRASKVVWEAFEQSKKQTGKTWNNFLKDLGYGNEALQKVQQE